MLTLLGTGSLRRKLLAPAVLCGLALAGGSICYIQQRSRSRLESSLEARGRFVANVVNFAAESISTPSDLQRLVTRIGADPDVLEIVVAGGEPARVLASTHGSDVDTLLTDLPSAELGADLTRAIAIGESRHDFNEAEHRYDYSAPLVMSLPATSDGRLTAGVVMVHLHTRPLQDEFLRSTAESLVGLGLALFVMTGLGYWRLRTVVLEPLAAVEQVVNDGAESDAAAWATVESDDEIGQLAKTLRESISARRASESKLRIAERLASVGTLAGGLAHEINTPLQFVSASAHFLREAAEDMIGTLVATRSLAAEAGDAAATDSERQQALTSIVTAIEDVDADYLASRIPGAVTRCVDGIERVKSIVASMKASATRSSGDLTPDDVNRAVQSALAVMESECRRVASLTVTLRDLPSVSCHIGDLREVVTHLLANAVDAVSEANQTRGQAGEILVTTEYDGQAVVIAVRDNGVGIPEDVAPRVFDPFFTTKPVGRGTGQGLATSWQLVTELHGGTIWFDSSAGVGTTFSVRLPIAAATPGTAAPPTMRTAA